MKTSLDCIPCIIRQTLEAARLTTSDTAVQEQITREVLHWTAEMELTQTPPALGQRIHRRLREMTGIADPYRAAKDRFNRMAMDLLPELKAGIKAASDPLEMAVRLAIAGNVIDMGVNGNVTEEDVRNAIDQALTEPFTGEVNGFRQAVSSARNILYLADNAGEIVFDQLLIEQLSSAPVTLAVRGAPIINDATMTDARAVGLHKIAEIIDNGSDAPGTILKDCSEEFIRRFTEADLIIAKGQGNFETLSDERRNIFFLFKAKCPVIAARVRLPVGTQVLMQSCTKFADSGDFSDVSI